MSLTPPADSIRYKRPGVIRAAFRYQDLVAIETLVRFHRDRSLYQWVQLDSDDAAFGGVDDVVACRADGTFELLQVKFTPNPGSADSALGWKWLLARKPAGTSLLQKWASTVARHVGAKNLASAALRTDRIPDPAFAATLSGLRVDFQRVDPDVQALIEDQLGGRQSAEAFFAEFDFHHSQPVLVDLEDRLRTDVAFDLDKAAWLAFRDTVETWATLKDRPLPDGRIRHEHLRQALSHRRPRPLPQGFEVPLGYKPPDAAHAKAFLEGVAGADGVTVLSAPPGRGKSTFLSYAVDQLAQKGLVVVRHHYFLDLADTSANRFHYHEIAQSLTAQLQAQLPGVSFDADDLSGAISAAGARQHAAGKRLIVVIDGLDHVWREGRSKEHMAQLFAELLPATLGVSLVVGTQPAPDAELPVKLLQAAPKAGWLELPLMSEAAVGEWLKAQDAAGRLNLDRASSRARGRARAALAAAFFDFSGGLPLQLIYGFEALVRQGVPVTVARIEALPTCPGGDIRQYYATLWAQVGARAQDILHVLAALPFALPPLEPRQVFNEPGDAEALARIDHLLDHRDLGVFAFHGSLFAFVKEQAGAAVSLAGRKAKILSWLEHDAPSYWRWAWLWLTEAEFGSVASLVAGPDRPWALAALAAAYPVYQIERILLAAEQAAFAAFDLPRTLELRLLRGRVSNGAEYQTDRWDLFVAAALETTSDPYPLAALRSDLLDLEPAEMALVLRRATPGERPGLARKALDAFNLRVRRDSKRDRNWRRELPDAVGQVVAHLDAVDPGRFNAFCDQYDDPDGPLTAYAREVLRMQEAHKVLKLATIARGPEFNAEVFAAACRESIDPFAPGSRLSFGEDVRLNALSLMLGGTPPPLGAAFDASPLYGERDLSDRATQTRTIIAEMFFRAFTAAFDKGEPAPTVPGPPADSPHAWLHPVLTDLADTAVAIADAWLSGGEPPSMTALYASLDPTTAPDGGYEVYVRYDGVRRAVLEIAVDLQLLGVAVSAGSRIDADDVSAAATSPFWLDEAWLRAFGDRPLLLHVAAGAQALADRLFVELDTGVTQFAERTELCTRLSIFCAEHGLTDAATAALRRAANGLTGYGWRKDMFGYEVLTSIDLLHDAGDPAASDTLVSLAPIFDQITDFTDGDETDHIRSEFYALLARFAPDRAAGAYGHLVEQEAWRYADGLLLDLSARLSPGPRRQALLATFIQPTEYRWLTAPEQALDADAPTALTRVTRHLGRAAERPSPVASTARAPDRQPRPFNIKRYGPERLDRLVAALDHSRVSDKRGAVRRWLDHWDAAGRGIEALQALADTTIEDRLWLFADLYDAAFSIALARQGRSAAFDWLVLAHRANYGWQRWLTSKEAAIARLDAVATHYPSRWREFVQKTANPRPSNREPELVIGQSRLVYLLVKVGEVDLARAVTAQLVATLRAETAEQPLPQLAWAQ
jgi:hypothetical protein